MKLSEAVPGRLQSRGQPPDSHCLPRRWMTTMWLSAPWALAQPPPVLHMEQQAESLSTFIVAASRVHSRTVAAKNAEARVCQPAVDPLFQPGASATI